MNFLYMLAGIRCAPLDMLFKFFTLFGEEFLVMTVLCALLWCADKKLAYRLGLVYFVSGMAVQTLKISFRTERPWMIDPQFSPVEGSKLTATGYSFPSGHTQSATALYGTLGLAAKRGWRKAVLLGIIILVALSRMYLGVHTPLDVIGGFAITAVICAALYYPLKKYDDTPALIWILPLALTAASSAAIIYTLYLINNGFVPVSEGVDCLKGAGAGLGFAIGYYIERRFINYDEKAGTRWVKLLKLIIGLGMAFILRLGLKLLLGTSIWADIVRYAILTLWVIAIYPALFSRLKCLQKV